MKTNDYIISQTILQSDDVVFYRATSTKNQIPVIIKIVEAKQNASIKQDYLKREFNFLSSLDIKSILKPLALISHLGKPALVMENFNGIPLDDLLGHPMEIETFLRLAELICAAIADIHRHNIIHKNLKPQNILIDISTNTVKLTGFGLSSMLPREHWGSGTFNLLEGSLPYMSPEQTGRMNRAIDNRSDLYSLGIIFYQMLTGKLPFEAKDPLEWIHCHVARVPPLVSQTAIQTPEILTSIISSLLTKVADERYQTANGLHYDLILCLQKWHAYKNIYEFPIKEKDVSNRLIIPQKLYGRKKEIEELIREFDKVVSSGRASLALISGYSGIGKTSLVNELHRPILQEHGFFISGVFDQYKRDIPFSTIVQAFRELVQVILLESEEKNNEWKDLIQQALGDNAQLVVDVIPQIELLIGKQKPVSELPFLESQSRFKLVFQKFIMVFTGNEHPLTLFLDDLQWADSASLALVSDLMTNPDTSYVFIIGSYRDNEVDAAHPLMHVLNNIKKCGTQVVDIVLAPLSLTSLTEFIADTFRSSHLDIKPLAEILFNKTAGSPFFTIQFLISMYEEDLIKFDEERFAWKWDTEKIQSKNFTDNVADLIVRKIKRLSLATQEYLKQMSCLGISVEIHHLQLVLKCTKEELQDRLWEALSNGIIVQNNESYKFLHGKIFEAVNDLIPKKDRAIENLRIARIFLEEFSNEEIEENIFDIVNHLNQSSEIMYSRKDENNAAKLNLLAATRSRNATAFKSAVVFCDFGQRFLGLHAWNSENANDFNLSFSLTLIRAECELAIGNFEETEKQISLLLQNAQNRTEQSVVRKIQIDLLTAKGLSDEALVYAIDCMKLFGISLDPHPSLSRANELNLTLDKKIKKIGLDSILFLPLMEDKDIEAAMGILAGMLPNAYFTDVHLHRMIACHMIDLTLNHGVCALSAMGLAAYGFELCAFDRYVEAAHYGRIASDLINLHKFVSGRAKVYNLVGATIAPWTEGLKSSIRILQQGIEADDGDLIFSCLCNVYIVPFSMEAGEQLDELELTAERVIKYIIARKYDPLADVALLFQKFIKCLHGETDATISFGDARLSEAELIEKLEVHPLKLIQTWYHVLKLQAAIYFNDIPSALTYLKSTEALIILLRGQQTQYQYTFFAALTITGAWDTASLKERKKWKPILIRYNRRLKNWAAANPSSYLSQYSLVAAEVARIENKYLEAERLYLTAINTARDNGLIQYLALSYERTSYFYKFRGFDFFADACIREASISYKSWGASAKVSQLERLHPEIEEKQHIISNNTLVVRSEQLDLLSAIKASQAISSKMDLNSLILKLLDVALEQSGAQTAKLILSKDSILTIQAKADIDTKGIKSEILNAESVLNSKNIPLSLIRYVQRTKELIIFDDTKLNAEKFLSDEYIARTKPKSILCLPILRGSELAGILYLENNIISGLFSAKRLSALELLASQAAISLQNAILYKSLAEENAQRKQTQIALRSSQEQLRAIIDSSTAVIYMKNREGKFILINRRFEILFNVKNDWVVGKTDYDIFDKAVADDFRQNDIRVIETNKTLEKEEVVPQNDGLHTYISIKFPLFDSEGFAYAVCGISTDITDRKRIEREREKLLIHEQVALVAAQKSIQTRDDFISIASHELRTPLTPLKLYLDMLKKTLNELPEELHPKIHLLKKAFDKSDESLHRLTKLTKDLLDVSRITSGRIELNRTEINLSSLVKDCIERKTWEFENAHCKLIVDLPELVLGFWDPMKIDQVVENLMSNALKYGIGNLIEITLKTDATKAILTVRDHGIGIEKDLQDKIFNRFVRATSIKNYEGLGLGLYISREIVVAHGGNITVKSELGLGATFTVELPLSFT